MESNQRYFPPKKFIEQYNQIQRAPKLEVIGYSVKHRPIYAVTIGGGGKKILAWSQMHGNETTTTRALLPLVRHLLEPQMIAAYDKFCIKIIFQLNPDGSQRYTRVNANDVDLNRDAFSQTQPETKVLIRTYKSFAPDFCLNLHGQRTIYAAGNTAIPAALSFLAPSADDNRSITPARETAMQLIASIASAHTQNNQWGIGRYDDAFNINCTGDYFTSTATPTLLFEAGHYPSDYHRNTTEKLILKSLIITIENIVNQDYTSKTAKNYFKIPENQKTLCDVEFTNVTIVNNSKITKSSIYVQYKEILEGGIIRFIPQILEESTCFKGLRKIDLDEKTKKNPIIVSESLVKTIEQLKSLADF